MRLLIATSTLLFALAPASAQDAIAPETVEAVKRATVFVRVEADDGTVTGSGFAVGGDGGAVLVATNHHVAAPARFPGANAPALTVVFGSGTQAERAYPATVAAGDPDRDLAVLRVAGVVDPPKPIPVAGGPRPTETMTVYTFGFPFGTALATGKGFPAVTVGKASVSSLRRADDGDLTAVQIDGNLNPGNSGGPVVDTKGRLIGVAVATIRDGQGIGLTVPAAELDRTLRGRIGRVRVTPPRPGADPLAARIEADLIDPAGNLKGVTARYLVVPPGTKRPASTSLDKHPDVKTLALTVDAGTAAGDIPVPTAAGELLVRVTADAGPGRDAVTGKPDGFSLVPSPATGDFVGPPPTGWVEYIPKDRSFAVWLPARAASQRERQRTVTAGGQRMTVNSVVGTTTGGLVYHAEHLILPPALAGQTPVKLHALLRAALLDEGKGRFTESTATRSGPFDGVQYRIDYGGTKSRARVFVGTGGAVRLVRVIGSAAQVDAAGADTILLSFRLLAGDAVAGPTSGPAPVVVAGAFNPLYKDVAPPGGLLVGLELGLGKFFDDDVIQAVRPIYRVGDKEVFGEQKGTKLSRVFVVKAKPGYAVGALACKSGLNFDGCSVTFMKVAGGKLVPANAYESEWVGWNKDKPVQRLGGDGTPVVGVVGRSDGTDVNGFGLLFKGQEGFAVAAKAGGPAAGGAVPPQSIPTGKEPYIFGTIRDPHFKALGPAGGVLIGLEAKFVKFGNQDIVRGVRPIYRVNGKEENGQPFGIDTAGGVVLRAKAGYAVGMIRGKANWWCHGFALTYLRVRPDGTLDPNDRYESEWAGWDGDIPVTTAGGGGGPAVGIVGKVVRGETTALGLVFKGQEAWQPPPDQP